MKRLVICFLCLFTVLANAKTLQVVVKVPTDTPKGDPIYLNGNLPQCKTRPMGLPLKRLEPYTYGTVVEIPDSFKSVTLHVTRGSNDKAAALWNSLPAPDFVVKTPEKHTEFAQEVVNWTDLPPQGVVGDLRIMQNVWSPQLKNSRNVRVWLPPDYEKNPKARYPVIYMHDGQNLFDPKTANNGADWRIGEVMTELQKDKKLKSGAIVVGVDFTDARFDEYDYTSKGALYADFLIDTVKPMIDQKFRTLPGRESTFTMGSSMGAIISIELVWRHPEVFSRAGALSLPAFINDWSIFHVVTPGTKPSLPIQIYMDHGTVGGDAGYPKPAELFHRYLLQLLPERDVDYKVYEYADHYEADWARRVDVPIRWMINSAPLSSDACLRSLSFR